MADDLYQNLLRILRYESKDTTYKFALLRGLIEISSESPHITLGTDFVTVPFGILIENGSSITGLSSSRSYRKNTGEKNSSHSLFVDSLKP